MFYFENFNNGERKNCYFCENLIIIGRKSGTNHSDEHTKSDEKFE